MAEEISYDDLTSDDWDNMTTDGWDNLLVDLPEAPVFVPRTGGTGMISDEGVF
jgi:hypothetical protein